MKEKQRKEVIKTKKMKQKNKIKCSCDGVLRLMMNVPAYAVLLISPNTVMKVLQMFQEIAERVYQT